MDVAIKILQFIASFSLLVFVHELGHFIFAKMFGMRVDKFYLFFNPWFSLVKFRIGETEFGIGWVPFGGYCKIAGMIDESMDTESLSKPPQPYEFRAKPAWQRLLVMLGGVLMNVLLAICIYIGMSHHYGEKYFANNDVVYGWSFSELGHEMGFRNGDKIISVDGKSYTKAEDIVKKIALSDGASVEVMRDGQAATVEISPEFTARKLKVADLMEPRMPFVVDSLVASGPAATAGMIPGDSLIAANGVPMGFFDQYSDYLHEAMGRTIEVTFVRDSAGVEITRTLPVTVSNEGKLGVIVKPMVIPVTEVSYTWFESIPAGLKKTSSEISSYLGQVKLIFTPKTEAYKNLGGPIMIGSIFPGEWVWERFWSITAFISIVLAVMNILPIPALDGGHVLFLLYEVITGRKPSDKFMEYAQIIGMILIFALMIYATGNDIYRFFIK